MEIKVYPVTEKDALEDLIRIIRESPARRIVLYAEKACPALRDPVNLRLLRYYSEERRIELVVIARDPVICREAEREGLYRTDLEASPGAGPDDSQLTLEFAAQAEDDVGTINRHIPLAGRERRPAPGRLVTALVAAFLTFLSGIYLLFAPRVTLVAYPTVEQRRLTVDAKLSPAYSEEALEQDCLPGRVVERRCEAAYTTPATGRKTVGYRAATGRVTFYNGQSRPIVIPKGTEIAAANGEVFVTERDALAPPKTRKTVMNVVTGENYGQVEVAVKAVKKGAAGNVPRHTLTKIRGKLGKELQATNFVPTAGGEDRQIPVVTEEDLSRCEAEVRRQMELAAADEIRGAVGTDYVFLPELVSVQELELLRSCNPGEEKDQVEVKLTYSVKTVAVAKDVLYKHLNLRLQSSLPPYLQPAGGVVRLLSIAARPGNGRVHSLTIQAETTVQGRLDRRRIIRRIAGKELFAAQQALAALPEIGRFNLQTPPGMKRLPRWGFQIRVILPSVKTR